MLVKNLPGSFVVRNVLSLPGLLLYQFVRYEETHGIVSHGDAQAVLLGKNSLVRSRKARCISAICEILKHRRIQVTVAMKTVRARRKAILPRGIRKSPRTCHRRKA